MLTVKQFLLEVIHIFMPDHVCNCALQAHNSEELSRYQS